MHICHYLPSSPQILSFLSCASHNISHPDDRSDFRETQKRKICDISPKDLLIITFLDDLLRHRYQRSFWRWPWISMVGWRFKKKISTGSDIRGHPSSALAFDKHSPVAILNSRTMHNLHLQENSVCFYLQIDVVYKNIVQMQFTRAHMINETRFTGRVLVTRILYTHTKDNNII